MNSNELYEKFLKYCKEYEMDLDIIVIKKDDTSLRIMKPYNPDENDYLIYEIRGKSRISGSVSDIYELLELCEEIIGEDSIIKNNGYGK